TSLAEDAVECRNHERILGLRVFVDEDLEGSIVLYPSGVENRVSAVAINLESRGWPRLYLPALAILGRGVMLVKNPCAVQPCPRRPTPAARPDCALGTAILT